MGFQYTGDGEQLCVYVEEIGGYVYVPARTLTPTDVTELEEHGVSTAQLESVIIAPAEEDGDVNGRALYAPAESSAPDSSETDGDGEGDGAEDPGPIGGGGGGSGEFDPQGDQAQE